MVSLFQTRITSCIFPADWRLSWLLCSFLKNEENALVYEPVMVWSLGLKLSSLHEKTNEVWRLSNDEVIPRVRVKIFNLRRTLRTLRTFPIEDCIFLHCSALDITCHAIECGVTTCPGYGESCHRWPSLIKWSLTTIVLRLKEIRYCSIVANGSLKTLAFHSLPKHRMQKIQKSWNKMCDN